LFFLPHLTSPCPLLSLFKERRGTKPRKREIKAVDKK